MIQDSEHFTERVVVYVTPSMRGRLTRAIQASGFSQSDWLRRVLSAEVVRSETGEIPEEQQESVAPAVAVAAAEARIQGLEEIIQLQRERLGMADAMNVDLSRRLEEAHTSVSRLTLALPAAEGPGSRRFNWRFWQR